MSKALSEELHDIASRSRGGASEREIETDLVHFFGNLGWSRSQIRQDVPASERKDDKSDIVLFEGEKPRVVVEVKRVSQTRDAEGQLQRYADLLKPQLALLTDGNEWILYYVGHERIALIFRGIVLTGTCAIEDVLEILRPQNLSTLTQNGTFSYLELIDQALNNLSQQQRSRMTSHFATTVNALLQARTYKDLTEKPQLGTVLPVLAQTVSLPKMLGEPLRLAAPTEPIEKEYNPTEPPDLEHTRILEAKFGQEITKTWNGLVHFAIRAAVKEGLSVSDIQEATGARLKEGTYSELGYKQVKGTNISIQGVASNSAWKYVVDLNGLLEITLIVKFRWHDKEDAAFPGQIGKFVWPSKNN